ncbi:superoxide dismutase [Hyphobacterium marinum]|uniref:Superoxide dismutase n=1 Tax=Hyphobacterium marinum TaxID=3116574 RepID=A0ABU7M1I5_9PROT|nr:superoxide dismutase [Hyphobacterium sp. Y6023]MEE2567635.1 superoxide dismutase [Hyphobacterium sp. Y6023]
MAFTLPDLPYSRDALEPHMSARTLEFHHGKHHAGYVKKLNDAIAGTKFDDMSLKDIIRETAGDEGQSGIFNNAAQTWNHTFFWNSMSPDGGGEPTGALAEAIAASFGSFDGFKEKFSKAAAGQFGSGWAWLVAKDGKLVITTTPNAETPVSEEGVTPLLTLDVWEHAYYLDFQNARPNFIETWLNELANWDFAADNFAAAG